MKRLLAVFTILLMLAATLGAQGSATDNKIYDEVRQKLANDQDVRGAGLEVVVKDGAVTLRGRVRNERAKEKATSLTKKIKGVKQVTNELTLLGS